MKKNLILFCILIAFFSCDENDTKTYYIRIQNESEYNLIDITIEMESFNTGTPDSIFVNSVAINTESEKFKFKFDRTSSDGCNRFIGITLAASFNGNYTQNDSLKYFSVDMENRDLDYVTVIVDNDSYSIFDN